MRLPSVVGLGAKLYFWVLVTAALIAVVWAINRYLFPELDRTVVFGVVGIIVVFAVFFRLSRRIMAR